MNNSILHVFLLLFVLTSFPVFGEEVAPSDTAIMPTPQSVYLEIASQSASIAATTASEIANSIQLFILCFFALSTVGALMGLFGIPWITAKNVERTKHEIMQEVTESIKSSTSTIVRHVALDVSEEFTAISVELANVNSGLAGSANGKVANAIVNESARTQNLINWIQTQKQLEPIDKEYLNELAKDVMDEKDLYAQIASEMSIPRLLYALMHPKEEEIPALLHSIDHHLVDIPVSSGRAIGAVLLKICNSTHFGPKSLENTERLRSIGNRYTHMTL